MTAAPIESSVALDEGGEWKIKPNLVGPASAFPRLADVREIWLGSTSGTPETVVEEPRGGGAETNESGDRKVSGPVRKDTTPEFSEPVKVTAMPAPTSAPAAAPAVVRLEPVAAAEPAAAVEQPDSLSLWAAVKQRIAAGGGEAKQEPAEDKPPSLMVLWIVGALAVAATGAAFILSYTMLLLVIEATGWRGEVAQIGPLVPDVAALAAAVMLVSRTKQALAWSLLIGSTGMSIVGNLAGHAIQREAETTETAAFPPAWSWVGDTFSVFMPVVMAFLVHIFMEQLASYLAWCKREREKREEQERLDREAREKAEKAERERREREAQAQAAREEALASLPSPPRKSALVDRETAVQYGVAHEAHTPARLSRVLEAAGWKPRSETTMKDYCREIKHTLGLI